MPCCKTIVWNKGCRRFCWLPGGVRQGLAQLQARWGEGAFSTPVAARESIQVFEQNLRSVFYGITESDWVSSGPMPWPGEAPWVFSTTSAASQLTAVLGGEFDVLVFNAWAGFHPDRFAMLCGVVRGGGCIVLITPEPEQWPNFPDPEYDRLIGLLDVERDASFHLNVFSPYLYRLVRQLRDEVAGGRVLCGDVPQYLPAHQATAHKKQTALSPTLTQHQVIVALVEQVERFAIGQFGAEYTDFQCNSFGLQCNSLPPLGMIQGARGRGKSQVLAWLIEAFLASSAVRTVHLLAPHAEAMATIRRFFQDRGVAPTYINTSSKINASSKWIVWENVQTALSRLPLHTSCSTDNEAWRDVLLVEEAATIPFPHLQKLAQFSGSLIVASTTQGYEGSGRILAVRLQEWAYAQARTVSVHTLIEPLRWGLNDPAETCVNRLLLLSDMENGDATERFAAIARSAVSSVRYTWHSSSNLMQAQHEDCLASLWSLLYGAHYRTRPSDLRALLDQPDVYVLMAHDGNHCVGAAWFVLEGPFSDRLQQEMCHNRRRPRGHILPQIWALRLGVRPALGWRHARCVRIAVAPSARQQGVGRGLLETAKTF
ncbi:MAG: GNAT family N-acetyltransferase, partial [Gammaproteobacteria bacterium]